MRRESNVLPVNQADNRHEDGHAYAVNRDPVCAARLAIQTARAQNMPMANIQRAMTRAGGGDAADLRDATYEGWGPDGVAVVVDVQTDNTNRTVSFVRSTLVRHGGSLGAFCERVHA